MVAAVNKSPMLKDGEYQVEKVTELSFFDLIGDKAKTQGTSNKSYHLELQIAKIGAKAQLHSMWGPTGGTQTKEWRYYNSKIEAEKDFAAIVKSKTKKGYKEVDVAIRAMGSEAAKQITKAVSLTNADPVKSTSALDSEVQRLVGEWFNITNNWVVKTLRCPLGQLTNEQIDKGRGILEAAQQLLDQKKNTTKTKKIEDLTNDFYATIPHNLGQGARGQLTNLLLDDKIKIAQKNDDLDLLLDAKAAGASLSTSSSIDEKYKTLNCQLKFIDHKDPIFLWIDKMVHETRASNHRFLGKIKVHNVFELHRNGEENIFLGNAEKIAKTEPKKFMPSVLKDLAKNRPALSKDLTELYNKSNTLPVWHGTRRANMVGITMKGFLIRPAGAVLAGSMYGHGTYYATNSTKSINYCDSKNSYWAGGGDGRAFLFLCDVAFGEPKLASGSYMYNLNNIKGHHSVWAQAGKSGVINDELICYNPSGPSQQHCIRYIVEFESGL